MPGPFNRAIIFPAMSHTLHGTPCATLISRSWPIRCHTGSAGLSAMDSSPVVDFVRTSISFDSSETSSASVTDTV